MKDRSATRYIFWVRTWSAREENPVLKDTARGVIQELEAIDVKHSEHFIGNRSATPTVCFISGRPKCSPAIFGSKEYVLVDAQEIAPASATDIG